MSSPTAAASPSAPYTPPASPSPEPPARLELSRGKRIAFASVLLVVTWLVLELCASVYLRATRGYDGTHLYEFEFDPYKNILPAPGFVDTRGVRHNAQGFRHDGIVPVEKPAGTYRVFLMGGSTAYGTGGLWPHLQTEYAVLKNEETIDRYLERELTAALPAGTRVEVINAAITSTWTHHHLIYLNQTILRFQPDMVLFLDGFNDFFHYGDEHDQFGRYIYNTQASSILGPPTLSSLAAANGWWIYRKSPLAHVTMRAARQAKLLLTAEKPESRAPMDVDKAVAGVQRNFPRNAGAMHRRISLILRDEGIRAVFMLQPMLVLERDKKPMSEVERKLFEFNVESYLPGYEPFAHRAVAFFREREQAMADETGAQFIDLTNLYDGVPEQMYTDYVHLTPQANERLARAVATRVLPTIRDDLARGRPSPAGTPAPATVAAR